MQVRSIWHVTRPQLTKTKLPRGFKTKGKIFKGESWLKSCLKLSVTLMNNVMFTFTYYSFYNLILMNYTRLKGSYILRVFPCHKKSNFFVCWSDRIPLIVPSLSHYIPSEPTVWRIVHSSKFITAFTCDERSLCKVIRNEQNCNKLFCYNFISHK
jgi:hypothetical protein